MRGEIKLSFLGGLQLLFIGLKLAGAITWSWWWVMSPTIGITVLILTVLGVMLYLEMKKKPY